MTNLIGVVDNAQPVINVQIAQSGPRGIQGPPGPMGRVYFPTFYVSEDMELIMKDDFGYDRNIGFVLVDGYLMQKVG